VLSSLCTKVTASDYKNVKVKVLSFFGLELTAEIEITSVRVRNLRETSELGLSGNVPLARALVRNHARFRARAA